MLEIGMWKPGCAQLGGVDSATCVLFGDRKAPLATCVVHFGVAGQLPVRSLHMLFVMASARRAERGDCAAG